MPPIGAIPNSSPRLHRFGILSIYVLANLYAVWHFSNAEATTSEFSGLPVTPTAALFAGALAISFLCAATLLAQPLISRLTDRYIAAPPAHRSNWVGVIVFGILVAQLVYAVTSGKQVAGQLIYIDDPWALFFLLFNGDYIFLAYYCFYRESKWIYPTMGLFLASGLIRGWATAFLILGVLEVGRQLRWKSHSRALLISAALILIAPSVYLLREYFRFMGTDMQGSSVLSASSFNVFRTYFEASGILDTLANSVETLLLRIQHVEVDLVVSSASQTLSSLYERGVIRPFFAEGILGKLALQLLGEPIGQDLHIFLPQYFHGWATYYDVGYNVHVGLGSWLAIRGLAFPLVLLYSCLMIAFAELLIRWNSGTKEADDMAWMMALVFICSGWFGPYEAFLQALVLVIGMEALFVRVSNSLKPHHLIAS